MVRALLIAIALSALTGTAMAQDRVDAEFTFEDESVVGGRDGTDLDPIHVLPRPMRRTLVQARRHFVPEMLRSVENL